MAFGSLWAQEIIWKGRELQSSTYKTIEGEITIRTPDDTVRASKAILFNEPKRAILKGNVSLVRAGTLVTGDSAIYYPPQKMVDIMGNGVINTKEGVIKSQSFRYDLTSKVLSSNSFTSGTANGIRFSSDRSIINTSTQNLMLIGNGMWENDTIKGLADTIYLDKVNNTLKMSRKAKIIFKKKNDEISGKLIELDLKTSRVTKIEGSRIKRKDLTLKAKTINQKGEDYYLDHEVEIQSADSSVTTMGDNAIIKKTGLRMTGNTVTRIIDKQKQEVLIYAPQLISRKDSGIEKYNFFKLTNIRGQFNGFGDSLVMVKHDSIQEIFLYQHCHLQNDSMYIEGDTIELYQDSTREIIRAKRNAMMIMITNPNRVNIIQAAYITLTKRKDDSELHSTGSTDSYLWNDEKSNIGLNHTLSGTQKATIRQKKISKVKTTGTTSSQFTPSRKVNYSYMDAAAVRLKETYKSDSISKGLSPLRNFLERARK